ncbi:hypothetical protein ACSNOI_42640 [Actinomadura kijaniata]|uniref:hypothetical protein n=1 Tax=Actinomadura kijaniata TaxID=46161 RepID=UPI003F1CC4ED
MRAARSVVTTLATAFAAAVAFVATTGGAQAITQPAAQPVVQAPAHAAGIEDIFGDLSENLTDKLGTFGVLGLVG